MDSTNTFYAVTYEPSKDSGLFYLKSKTSYEKARSAIFLVDEFTTLLNSYFYTKAEIKELAKVVEYLNTVGKRISNTTPRQGDQPTLWGIIQFDIDIKNSKCLSAHDTKLVSIEHSMEENAKEIKILEETRSDLFTEMYRLQSVTK